MNTQPRIDVEAIRAKFPKKYLSPRSPYKTFGEYLTELRKVEASLSDAERMALREADNEAQRQSLRWKWTDLFWRFELQWCWLHLWFMRKTNASVLKNNGYVVVFRRRNGETFEVLRTNPKVNMSREEFLEAYVVGDVCQVPFWKWCRATIVSFIGDRIIDTWKVLDKVLDWMGFPNDEID